jgi:hypothetical protein
MLRRSMHRCICDDRFSRYQFRADFGSLDKYPLIHSLVFRYKSSSNDPKTAASQKLDTAADIASRKAKSYAALIDANAQMQKYHETRELMRQGKLPKVNNNRSDQSNVTMIQAGIFVTFLLAFMSTPFIGKKIAQDDEFREKYIPSWYDFTVKKPEHAWTRDELHEQMVQVHHDIHTRAIAGEFTPEKLQQMQNAMLSPTGSSDGQLFHPHRKGMDRSKIPKEWDMIHPGMAVDEELDERDS